MGDILSALSIILGIMSALYLHWASDINIALNKFPTIDDADDIDTIKTTLKKKVLPLLILLSSVSIIIFPVWLTVLLNSGEIALKNLLIAIQSYDIISAIILFIGILSFMLTGYILSCLIKLKKKIKPFK